MSNLILSDLNFASYTPVTDYGTTQQINETQNYFSIQTLETTQVQQQNDQQQTTMQSLYDQQQTSQISSQTINLDEPQSKQIQPLFKIKVPSLKDKINNITEVKKTTQQLVIETQITDYIVKESAINYEIFHHSNSRINKVEENQDIIQKIKLLQQGQITQKISSLNKDTLSQKQLPILDLTSNTNIKEKKLYQQSLVNNLSKPKFVKEKQQQNILSSNKMVKNTQIQPTQVQFLGQKPIIKGDFIYKWIDTNFENIKLLQKTNIITNQTFYSKVPRIDIERLLSQNSLQ